MPTLFTTLLQLNYQFSLCSFIYSTQYIFSLPTLFHRLQNSSVTLAIIQCFAIIPNQSQKVHSISIIANKNNYSPRSHKFTNSLQHLPVTMQKNHIFHQAKLLSLIKIFQWAQRCAWLNMLFQAKPEQQRAPAVYCKVFYHFAKCRTPPHSLTTTLASFHAL